MKKKSSVKFEKILKGFKEGLGKIEGFYDSFSKKGDFFATGGSDCNLLIWKSVFSVEKGETIKDKGLCQSGHRIDARTNGSID